MAVQVEIGAKVLTWCAFWIIKKENVFVRSKKSNDLARNDLPGPFFGSNLNRDNPSFFSKVGQNISMLNHMFQNIVTEK